MDEHQAIYSTQRADRQRAVPYVAVGDAEAAEVMFVPRNRDEAFLFREQTRDRQTFCPTTVGGCGRVLDIVVPSKRIVPHGRHRATAECRLSQRGALDEHTQAQRALIEWLATQGHSAWMEVLLSEDAELTGRADIVADVSGLGLIDIEVQRSPDKVGQSADERTLRYLGSQSRVSGREGETIAAVAWLHSHDTRFPSISVENGAPLVTPAEDWGITAPESVPLAACALGITDRDLCESKPAPFPLVSPVFLRALQKQGIGRLRTADLGRSRVRTETLRLESELRALQQRKRSYERERQEAQQQLSLADTFRSRLRKGAGKEVAGVAQPDPHGEVTPEALSAYIEELFGEHLPEEITPHAVKGFWKVAIGGCPIRNLLPLDFADAECDLVAEVLSKNGWVRYSTRGDPPVARVERTDKAGDLLRRIGL